MRPTHPSTSGGIGLLVALACAAAATAAPTGMTPIQAQRAMRGTWMGDGTTMVVDTVRLQANLDPDKPFDWRTFRIVDVSGKMIVFDVGSMRYVALLATPALLTLTSPAFSGQRALSLVHR